MINKKGIKMTKELLQEELNKFLSDDKMKSLQKYIKNIKEEENNKFNIFKVLKLDNHEIRHSNFLAWLLNPKGNHNLGDKFLKRFLEEASIDISDVNTTLINIETEVCTDKKRRIDLLLYTKDFVCVIENKYGSIEHGGQCQDYKKFIEKDSNFKDYKNKYFVFLDIEEPDEKLLKNNLLGYLPLTYRKIYSILQEFLNSNNFDNEIIKNTIEQYVLILKEKYTIMDEKIKEQCSEIYNNYKDIYYNLKEYEKVFQTEIYNLMKEFIKENNESYVNDDKKYFGYNNNTGCGIRFIPKIYDNCKNLIWNDKTTKHKMFFFLNFCNGKLNLSISKNWKNIQLQDKNTQSEFNIEFVNKTQNEIKEEIKNAIEEKLMPIFKSNI